MTPPSWTSLPEMGLNFTSTKPSLRLASSLMQTGYVARPDCLSTFGLLGAVLSASIVHFASPVPVLVAVQPGGGAPAFMVSKFTVSARATTASAAAKRIANARVFTEASVSHLRFSNGVRPATHVSHVAADRAAGARANAVWHGAGRRPAARWLRPAHATCELAA